MITYCLIKACRINNYLPKHLYDTFINSLSLSLSPANRPPLPLYSIILIATAAAALIIIVVVILAIVFMVMSRRHRQKKTYFFNNQGKWRNMSAEVFYYIIIQPPPPRIRRKVNLSIAHAWISHNTLFDTHAPTMY